MPDNTDLNAALGQIDRDVDAKIAADDNTPAAVLDRTRQAYTDTGKRIETLKAEQARIDADYIAATKAHRQRMAEIQAEVVATKAAHQQWGRMLPRGDTARGNGTS